MAVAALSVALREHRADAAARVRSAEQRAKRIRELVESIVRETLECGEEGRMLSLIEPVLFRVIQEISDINGQARP